MLTMNLGLKPFNDLISVPRTAVIKKEEGLSSKSLENTFVKSSDRSPEKW